MQYLDQTGAETLEVRREGRSKGDAAGMGKKGVWSKRGAGKAHGVATAFSSVSALHAHKGDGDGEVLPLVTTEHGRSQSRCPMRDSFPPLTPSSSPDSVRLWDNHRVFGMDCPDFPGLSEVPSFCAAAFLH